MKNNNVEIKDFIEEEFERVLKTTKRLRSDYKNIFYFYSGIELDFSRRYFKINCISKYDFFVAIHIFFHDLDSCIEETKVLIKEWIEEKEEDIEYFESLKIDELQELLKVMEQISKYEFLFLEKEKKGLVDSDICIKLALLLDLISFIKIDLQDYIDYHQYDGTYSAGDMIDDLYEILFIEAFESSKDDIFGRFPIKFGVMHFFKRINSDRYTFEDDGENYGFYKENENDEE